MRLLFFLLFMSVMLFIAQADAAPPVSPETGNYANIADITDSMAAKIKTQLYRQKTLSSA